MLLVLNFSRPPGRKGPVASSAAAAVCRFRSESERGGNGDKQRRLKGSNRHRHGNSGDWDKESQWSKGSRPTQLTHVSSTQSPTIELRMRDRRRGYSPPENDDSASADLIRTH
jgi:hypothetical protein